MKALIVSKALVRAAYQQKLLDLKRLGCEARACVASSWIEDGHPTQLEVLPAASDLIRPLRIRFNGHFHFHYYPTLAAEIDEFGPDLVFVDEEPYNFASFQAVRLAAARRLPAIFFTWQNLDCRLPPPFWMIERYVYSHCRVAIAGTRSAEKVLRERGYRGQVVVTPQFGVDTEVFSPKPLEEDRGLVIGYVGRLVPPKGVHLLIEAAAGGIDGDWRLVIAGYGPMSEFLQRAAVRAGLAQRCEFIPQVPSTEVPALLRRLDVLVLPSLTTSRWKEQFGRILVEAMACGVAVIGSDSGEIPAVIGDAGLVFPENDATALRQCLQQLAGNTALRRRLAERGRQRAVELFSAERIARDTYRAFEAALA